jgi:hypothetical protein
MGRKVAFPGLQEKFETVLQNILEEGKIYQTGDILKKISENKNDLTPEEIDDLSNNWANYINRAKQNEVMISRGTRQGYQINSRDIVIDENGEIQIEKKQKEGIESAEKKNENWESFMHLPATIILSYEFSSRILSLKQKTTKMKWANPDMIMIRDSQGYSSEETRINHDILSLIDITPKYIVSSIELKYGLGQSRANVLAALSETAINGNWANENWLVCMDDMENVTIFDDDAMDFARINGIGIIKLMLSDMKEKEDQSLSWNILIPAKTKYQLKLNANFTKDGKKSSLSHEIENLVKEFDETGSYLEYPGNFAKLAELIIQAFENLLKQPGFISNNSTEIMPLFLKLGTNKEYRENIYQSIFNLLPKVIEMEPVGNIEFAIKADLDKLEDYPRSRYEKVISYAKLLTSLVSK